jgi:hypothetical protein
MQNTSIVIEMGYCHLKICELWIKSLLLLFSGASTSVQSTYKIALFISLYACNNSRTAERIFMKFISASFAQICLRTAILVQIRQE